MGNDGAGSMGCKTTNLQLKETRVSRHFVIEVCGQFGHSLLGQAEMLGRVKGIPHERNAHRRKPVGGANVVCDLDDLDDRDVRPLVAGCFVVIPYGRG